MRRISKAGLIPLALLVLLPACATDHRPGRPAMFAGEARPPEGASAFGSPEEALRLARSLRESGAGAGALAVLAAARTQYPKEQRIVSAYGRQALIMGDGELAGRLLREALRSDPGDWRAMSALAVLEGRAGRAGDARAGFLRAQSLSGESAVVLNNLGVTELLDGRGAEAAVVLRRALSSPGLSEHHAERIRGNLAYALAATGDFDAAERLAGRPMPRQLAGAKGETIARLMGLRSAPGLDRAGWAARIADASNRTSGHVR
jgi:Flp pilus assembly protein TadD